MYRNYLLERRRILIKAAILFSFLLVVMLKFAPQSIAHGVFMAAYVEGDMVLVESNFSDGRSCDNAKIEVFDLSGNMLLEGRTDEDGLFSFAPPQKSDLKLVLDAGMGHRDEYIVTADELMAIVNVPLDVAEAIPSPAAELHHPRGSDTATQITVKEIELIVDTVIQKRLHPLTQLVVKSQRNNRFSVTQIFGGLGYILGLMGIAMYFKSQKSDTA